MLTKKLTLVILAAGSSTRYGALKQIDSFTKYGETIIDFSLYDAKKAGFTHIIFIIRKVYQKKFEAIFLNKKYKNFNIDFVHQETKNVPKKYKHLKREKPWGTAHAILSLKNKINSNFAVINADDFYGRDAFFQIANSLSKIEINNTNFYMIGYNLKKTVSKNGAVSRGECEVSNTDLVEIIERKKIHTNNNLIYFEDNTQKTYLNPNTIVSMNFWGFTPKIIQLLEPLFTQFLNKYTGNEQTEFYLPSSINNIIKENKAKVSVLQSKSNWFGVTYIKDKKM